MRTATTPLERRLARKRAREKARKPAADAEARIGLTELGKLAASRAALLRAILPFVALVDRLPPPVPGKDRMTDDSGTALLAGNGLEEVGITFGDLRRLAEAYRREVGR